MRAGLERRTRVERMIRARERGRGGERERRKERKKETECANECWAFSLFFLSRVAPSPLLLCLL